MSYEIKTHGAFGRELQRVARDELDRALDVLQFIDRDTVATAPHEVRKRLKKLRALLLLLREPLGKKRYREEDAILRELGGALATLRDAQALLKTLHKLQRRFFPSKPPAVLRAMRRELERHERRCATEFLDSLVLDQSIAAIHAALDRVADWPVESYGWKQLRRAVKCSYRRSREAYARAHDSPDEKRLHRWRKRVKNLWFHLRLLRRICPALMEELAQDYEVLGEFLGDDHDLVILRDTLVERRAALADDAALETFLELLELRREELLDAAFDLGERLHADAPAVFARELDDRRSAGRARRRKARKLTSRLNPAR
jgi:CHAD domain-containing protein